MSDKTSMNRRRFLTTLAASAAALPLLSVGTAAIAKSTKLPHLTLSDPTAKALHYTEDASSINPKKEPAYHKGAKCANCQLYQGDRKAAWGPCAVFPGKAVKTTGWCTSHVDMTSS